MPLDRNKDQIERGDAQNSGAFTIAVNSSLPSASWNVIQLVKSFGLRLLYQKNGCAMCVSFTYNPTTLLIDYVNQQALY